jgi:hypothetical protein
MPEVQTNTESNGEMARQFIEFVMMQAQNAMLFLGHIPNPQTGNAEVNLPIAKMFIDQLVMIRAKTQGNLNKDESTALTDVISQLQMAFVDASRGATSQGQTSPPAQTEPAPSETAAAPNQPPPSGGEADSRKKFTKSYGA